MLKGEERKVGEKNGMVEGKEKGEIKDEKNIFTL